MGEGERGKNAWTDSYLEDRDTREAQNCSLDAIWNQLGDWRGTLLGGFAERIAREEPH